MDSSGWDARYGAAPELVWTAEPNRFVVEELAGLRPGRALDLAAGEGRNAVWLAERGWEVTAVDFSAVAATRGQQLARERGVDVTWVVADLLGYAPLAGCRSTGRSSMPWTPSWWLSAPRRSVDDGLHTASIPASSRPHPPAPP